MHQPRRRKVTGLSCTWRSVDASDAPLVEPEYAILSTLLLEIAQQLVPSSQIFTAVIANDARRRLGTCRDPQPDREAVWAFQLVVKVDAHQPATYARTSGSLAAILLPACWILKKGSEQTGAAVVAADWERSGMQHIRRTIEELRRYIAASETRADLEEVDVLLGVALDELRRKIAEQRQAERRKD